MIDKYTIGQKIREFRNRAKLSQFDLEVAIEASPGSLSRMESGSTNPSKETIHKIANTLNLTPIETALLLGVELTLVDNPIDDYKKLKKGYEQTQLDPYSFLKQYDLNKVLDKTITDINDFGYSSCVIFLKNPENETYQIAKSDIFEKSLELATGLLGKPIDQVEYSLTDQTLLTHAVLSGKIQHTNVIFELVFPHMGDIFIINSNESGKSTIAIPLLLNSKAIGCITCISRLAQLDKSSEMLLTNFAKSISSMIFTAQVNIEAQNRYLIDKVNRKNPTTTFFDRFKLENSNPFTIDYYTKTFWVLFGGLTVWWFVSQIINSINGLSTSIWGYIYFTIAIYAVFIGYKTFVLIGRTETKLGIMVLLLTTISLGHIIGQAINAYVFYYMDPKKLYPSPGEIGFATACILSVVLSLKIYKYIQVKNAFRTAFNNPTLIIITSILLIFAKYLSLNSLGNYWTAQDLITLSFDMLYIVGQSIAVSVALISTLLLRKSILCRETKMFFQLFFISSVILFFADAIFFYKYHSDTWVWGDIADFMYFLFYSIIAYGHVILLATIRQDLKIREGKPEDLKNNLRVIVNKLMATM